MNVALGCCSPIGGRVSRSAGSQLIEKVRDIVGVYMEASLNAVVLCVDDKVRVRLFNAASLYCPCAGDKLRGALGLHALRHDLALRGSGGGHWQYAHQVLSPTPLRGIPRLFGTDRGRKDREVHVVLDNYATQKTALVRGWLAKGPRCTLPQPTIRGSIRSGSGLPNLVKSRSSEAIITRSNNSRKPSKP